MLASILLSLVMALTSCKEGAGEAGAAKAPAAPAAGAPVAKIWVTQSGAVELDGKPAELDALEKALDDLAKRKGVVYYGRDAAGQEAPPTSMKIIKMITDRRLPIRLSTKKDFSDAVGADGQSH
ncbi:MAG TPA: hypothetical protein VND93_18065 [Myxococcales bacterium]|nr:hypothetical protein [Myxococcales bacterium]